MVEQEHRLHNFGESLENHVQNLQHEADFRGEPLGQQPCKEVEEQVIVSDYYAQDIASRADSIVAMRWGGVLGTPLLPPSEEKPRT